MRKVNVFKTEVIDRKVVRAHDYTAMFHQFVTEQQYDEDAAPRLMAIVELDDGSITTVAYPLIQFCIPSSAILIELNAEVTAPLPKSFGEFVFDTDMHKWREVDEGEIGKVLYSYDQMNAARIAAAKLKAP